jgi:hypothetical protein
LIVVSIISVLLVIFNTKTSKSQVFNTCVQFVHL